jgi:hypothetical protein
MWKPEKKHFGGGKQRPGNGRRRRAERRALEPKRQLDPGLEEEGEGYDVGPPALSIGGPIREESIGVPVRGDAGDSEGLVSLSGIKVILIHVKQTGVQGVAVERSGVSILCRQECVER